MLRSVQFLRALAASMVALFHSMDHVRHHADAGSFWQAGAAGVDVFFVISGFIMWHTGRDMTPGSFMRRRIERIVPMYWIATLAMFAMPFVSGTIAGGVVADPVHLITSLLFIPHETPGDAGRYFPTYTPGWTINFEMYFYAVFAVCLLAGTTARRLAALVGTLALFTLGGLVLARGSLAVWHTSPIIIEFAIGCLIGAAYSWLPAERRLPAGVCLALIAAGTALIALNPVPPGGLLHSRLLYWGLPAAMMVVGATFLERRGLVPENLPLKVLGDASYSLYLTHLFSIGAVAVIWAKLGMWSKVPTVAAFVPVSFAASLAVAVASYLLIERPLLDLTRRGLARARGLGAAARTTTGLSR